MKSIGRFRIPRKGKEVRPWAQEALEDLWRPSPDFIGPVAPPMWLWLKKPEDEQWRDMLGITVRNRNIGPLFR